MNRPQDHRPDGFIQLDDRLLTGNGTVDGQHQQLVDLINEVLAAEQADGGSEHVATALEKLAAYAATHFACEEQLMQQHGYPSDARAAHIEEHRALTEKIRDFVLRFRVGEVTSVRPLVDFLADWLRDHLDVTDRGLAQHIRSCTEAD